MDYFGLALIILRTDERVFSINVRNIINYLICGPSVISAFATKTHWCFYILNTSTKHDVLQYLNFVYYHLFSFDLVLSIRLELLRMISSDKYLVY